MGLPAQAGGPGHRGADLRAAVTKDPRSESLTGLGVVILAQGRPDEAKPFLARAIDADPTNAAAYDHLGTSQGQQGNLEGALGTYRRLASARPSPAAHREVAQVLERLGRPEEAQRAEQAAAKLEAAAPTPPTTTTN